MSRSSKKNASPSAKKRSPDWQHLAEATVRRYLRILRQIARDQPGLSRRGRLGESEKWGLDIRMVSPARMRRLNARFRGKDSVTDVLSFPAPEVFRAGGWLGELVICTGVMRRQAAELGHAPERELHVLVVHGLLHLLGFDHEKGARQAAEMARWESRLLRAAGRAAGADARGLIRRPI